MQGCPLRCIYCHNPDTWEINRGKAYTVDEIIDDILKYKSYMHFSGGGVTITGGEPLMQINFLAELIEKLKKEKIHIAIDTSGYIATPKALKLLGKCNLVLLDIKSFNSDIYKTITGVELAPTLKTLDFLNKNKTDVWIRFVLVPGYTDDLLMIDNFSKYLSKFNNIKKIDVLPFHKMGEFKWEELNLNYKLKNISEPDTETIQKVIQLFKKYNNKII